MRVVLCVRHWFFIRVEATVLLLFAQFRHDLQDTRSIGVYMLINHHIQLDSICMPTPETLQNTCFIVGKFENIGDRALSPNRLNHDSSSQQPQPIQFVPPLKRTHSGLNSNGAVVAISCAFKNELGSSSAKLPSPQ